LLKSYSIKRIFKLSVEDISNIDGFAELTAELIFDGLLSINDQYETLVSGGFQLENTLISSNDNVGNNFFNNKKIVFTGAMSKSRVKLEKQAKSYGVRVAKSVSSKTDFLIIGENVGQSKIKAAKSHEVIILSEAEYLKKLIST